MTMADLHALTAAIGELEDDLMTCMRCGMCQAVCPLYKQTGMEADVARGKLALLDGLLRQMFAQPQAVEAKLNKCLLCGSCQANCPSGVKVLDLFLRARAILSGVSGLSGAQRMILKNLLAHPRRFDTIMGWVSKFQGALTRPANELLGTSCARVGSALIGGRHFKNLAPVPFHQTHPRLDTPRGASGYKVAFFVGCLVDKFYPRIAHSAMALFEKLGVGVFIPESQGCCGIPSLAAGDTDSFERLVVHNLDRIEQADFDYLITACATCTSTIKKLWPSLAPPHRPELCRRTIALAEKTLDISQFLVDIVGLKAARQPAGSKDAQTGVTYHDPCHLKKSLGVSGQPRALLNASAGYRLVEMRDPDQCCGMGGSFGIKYYDISRRIGEQKREAIMQTGCRVVATGCPACMLQMSDSLSRGGADIAVRHVIEIFAEDIHSYDVAVRAHQAQEDFGSGFRTDP
jgi:glycolate dehydrogenase iron-sulfur subunit